MSVNNNSSRASPTSLDRVKLAMVARTATKKPVSSQCDLREDAKKTMQLAKQHAQNFSRWANQAFPNVNNGEVIPTPFGMIPTRGPSFSISDKTKETTQKAFVKGVMAPIVIVPATQPFKAASTFAQLNMRFPSGKFDIPRLWVGTTTSIVGKGPSQVTLLASFEAYKASCGDKSAWAEFMAGFFATVTQNLVASPFKYFEQVQIQHPSVQLTKYIPEQIAKNGRSVVARQMYSGLFPKIVADAGWFPTYVALKRTFLRDNDSVTQQIIKTAAIGGFTAFATYPGIVVQTRSMNHAKNQNYRSMPQIVRELVKEGKEAAKDIPKGIKRTAALAKPFYRGSKWAVVIMAVQAVAIHAVESAGNYLFGKSKK